MRKLRHAIEAFFVLACYGILKMLPLDAASAAGGFVGRTIGPHLGLTKRARRNLRRFMPELGEAGTEAVIAEMWDNLGRTAAEYAHLDRLRLAGPDARVELVGAAHARAARESGRPVIFYSAHLANWEIGALASADFGKPVHLVYRAANNRHVETLFRAGRGRIAAGLIPKGKEGARLAMEALRKGDWLAMLVDQKMNNGVPVPFFGVDAMTAPAIAALALRHDCLVIGARVERLGGARFRITLYPPLDLPSTGDRAADQMAVMRAVNADIERWIRERPGQWLWLHRRWPDA